jgi:putative membrane protein
MALAALAAGVALIAAAAVNYFQQRDFALEWVRRDRAST